MPSKTFTVEDPETISGLAALFVLDEGPRDAKNIVFVHGMGADHYEFIHQIRYFSDRYRLISFDQRGHGHSPSTFNMGIHRSALDLESLVDQLGLESFVLVGHSLGSMVALEYTASNPDRVEKLMLASGSPAISESLVSYFGLKIMPVLGPFLDDRTKKKLSNLIGLNIGSFGARTSPDILRYYFKENPLAFSDKSFAAITHYMKDIADFDFRPRLGLIKCPTLVTHGALDIGIYALPTLLSFKKIRGAKLRVFPTCGHSPNVEAPGEFNIVLEEFMKEDAAKSAAS